LWFCLAAAAQCDSISTVSLGRIVRIVLAVTIGLVPLVPPEHVHEGGEQQQHHVLVHRHAAPHAVAQHDTHQQIVDDDDGAPILTLAAVFTIPAALVTLAARPPQRVVALDPPQPVLVPRPATFVERLIHGPPRAVASLRAPPSFLPV
jgi:hypothetical protein